MKGEPFACADIMLLRAPLMPFCRGNDTRWNPAPELDEANALAQYISRLGRDPLFREALELSSPSLSGLIHRIDAGADLPKLKTLRRAAVSMARYQLRMSGRATPFGLMAGIAPARLGSSASVRFGHKHRKVARPDMAWLAHIVRPLERRADVLAGLRVMANSARVVRGDRVALTFATDMGAADEDEEEPSPRLRKTGVSLRHTPVVEEMLEGARRPISVPALETRVRDAFPGAQPGPVRRVIDQLVEHEFLLTDLRPPLHRDDPLDYVIERLTGAKDLPEGEALIGIRSMIASYNALPVANGHVALHALQGHMRTFSDVEKPLQVDVALDADVVLPKEVGREVERAVAVAWRMSVDDRAKTPLGQYHEEFLERYGTGRAVPLLEVLDPEAGLDAPPGYRFPPSRRRVSEERTSPEEDKRDRILMELLATATARGCREIVLGDETIAALTNSTQTVASAPPACELFMELVAPSLKALDSGDFRLIFNFAAPTIGATFGRFAHLLGDDASRIAAIFRGAETHGPNAIRANLVFQPSSARSVNIALTPQWLDYRIAIGLGPDGQEAKNIALDDLAVAATLERLVLISRSLMQEIVPTPCSMINVNGLAPNLARFLQELGKEGPRNWTVWNWGAANSAPFVPRIRYGRTVLCPAMWRLSKSLTASNNEDAWHNEFDEWRSTFRLPSQIVASFGDLRIPLDLDDPMHQRVLRQEVVRRSDLRLMELPGGEDYSDAWLVGPRGAHRSELVVPLIRRVKSAPTSSQPPVIAAPARDTRSFFQPGGQWLYAKLYSSQGNQNEVLVDHLTRLLGSGVLRDGQIDRWFFVRYNDPDPHIRLRFHSPSAPLWSVALPMINEWAQQLIQKRLSSRLVIDPYDPELERYGGPDAIAAAELAFEADSVASLALLRTLENASDLEPVVLAAASLVDLIKGFSTNRGGARAASANGYVDLLLLTGDFDIHRDAFTTRRQTALTVIDPAHDWEGLLSRPYGNSVFQAWAQRYPAVATYARHVGALAAEGRCWTPLERIAISLLHMHCNRLLGTNSDVERDALAIARGAVRAHRDRARFVS